MIFIGKDKNMITFNNSFLNDNQREAVMAGDGPVAVIAGPGSGKTTVIVNRVYYLLSKGIPPAQIVVITYTKAAAEEMRGRFLHLLNENTAAKGVTFGTFHAVLFRILRRFYGYTLEQLIREEVKYKLILQFVKELGVDYQDEEEFMKDLLMEMSRFKNDLIELEFFHSTTCGEKDFRTIVMRYENHKKEHRLFDFDDMLIQTYQLLISNCDVLQYYQKLYRYILIDEFQDINRVQYEIIKLLAKPENNFFIVGDDDQSIYSFRGARPEFLTEFQNEFKDVSIIVLNHNYRSTVSILQCANILITENRNRYPKEMLSERNDGEKPVLLTPEDFEEEARSISEEILKLHQSKKIPLDDIAVIYRTNIQARALVDLFLDYRIPMYVKDEAATIYDHWIVKDIEAYFMLANFPENTDAFLRIINKPNRYMSKEIIAKGVKRHPKYPINGLIQSESLENWQIDRLMEFQYHLQSIKERQPREAIKMIRKTVGYEEYITKYAQYKKMKPDGFFEILDEIQEGMRHYTTLQEYLEHLQIVREEMKEQKKHRQSAENSVVLSTMHGAKGLEFDTVFLVGCTEGIVPHDKSMQPNEIEEERRLFYVGMTRAKNRLYLSCPKKRFGADVESSRFIQEAFAVKKKIAVDFNIGQKIRHREYGQGVIEKLEGTIGIVKFTGIFVKKKLDLKLCYEKEIIQLLLKENEEDESVRVNEKA